MLFRKKKDNDLDNLKNSIISEDILENKYNKNNSLLISICTILLLPLIYVISLLLINCSCIRLYTLIFGFSLISMLITTIIICLVSIFFIKDNNLDDLELLYLEKKNNNLLRNKLLLTSFILFCSFFVLLIASIIVIMILM